MDRTRANGRYLRISSLRIGKKSFTVRQPKPFYDYKFGV